MWAQNKRHLLYNMLGDSVCWFVHILLRFDFRPLFLSSAFALFLYLPSSVRRAKDRMRCWIFSNALSLRSRIWARRRTKTQVLFRSSIPFALAIYSRGMQRCRLQKAATFSSATIVRMPCTRPMQCKRTDRVLLARSTAKNEGKHFSLFPDETAGSFRCNAYLFCIVC